MTEKRLSLGYRPRGCRNVRILGVKPNLADYDPESQKLISRAESIIYPTSLYAQPLSDNGKTVFPSPRDYFYHGNKIRQTMLFSLCRVPIPETRIYYGRQVQNAAWHFRFPFVAKLPRGSGEGRGVFLISNSEELQSYLGLTRTAYFQEYLPHSRDLRVVVTAGRVLASYWRTVPAGDFRANLFQGGQVSADDIPEEGLVFAVNVAHKCGFDDVGLDVCLHKGRWLVLEANMHYGLKGLAQTGVRLSDFLDKLIEEEVI